MEEQGEGTSCAAVRPTRSMDLVLSAMGILRGFNQSTNIADVCLCVLTITPAAEIKTGGRFTGPVMQWLTRAKE